MEEREGVFLGSSQGRSKGGPRKKCVEPGKTFQGGLVVRRRKNVKTVLSP